MSRRLATVAELAAAFAATVYVLTAIAQTPDAPYLSAGQLVAVTALAYAAFIAALVLYVAVRLGFPRMLRRWRRRSVRRAVRRLARDRARRMRSRHAARTGGARW